MFSLPVFVRWGGFGLPAVIAFEMFFCAFGPVVNAQTTHVRGRVTDRATGEALPGASVWLVGTYEGVTADLDGHTVEALEARCWHRVNYTHLGPYFALVRQGPDFAQAPENGGDKAFFSSKD